MISAGARRRARLAATGAGLILVGAATVACGEEEEAPYRGPAVTLRVTEDFGRHLLSSQDRAPAGHRTVMRLVEEYHEIDRGETGIDVRGIDGRRVRIDPPAYAWALNVNGIESDTFPAEYRIHPGDVVQFDHRYWYVTLDVRATVGAFPETFSHGVFGRRFPVRVLCELPRSEPCTRVKRTLREAGVAVDGSKPPGPLPRRGLPRRARVLVGKWEHWRNREWPHRIDEGARYSGVFARFSPDGDELRLLDWRAHRARTESAGTGLVAAMRPTEEDLMWVVTGVDDLGVERAARALSADDLRDAFAVVATQDGVEKLPLAPPAE